MGYGVNEGFYENPLPMSYNFGEQDFTAANAFAIRKPKNARFAKIREIHVAVTTTFTQDTNPGYVRVGTTGDADKFAELNMGTAAATDGYGTHDNDAIEDAGEIIDLENDGDSGASLSQLEVAMVSPTGGTPAGAGIVTVVVEWF